MPRFAKKRKRRFTVEPFAQAARMRRLPACPETALPPKHESAFPEAAAFLVCLERESSIRRSVARPTVSPLPIIVLTRTLHLRSVPRSVLSEALSPRRPQGPTGHRLPGGPDAFGRAMPDLARAPRFVTMLE
jgi:hypothetical protein